jgi:hypothetical protein
MPEPISALLQIGPDLLLDSSDLLMEHAQVLADAREGEHVKAARADDLRLPIVDMGIGELEVREIRSALLALHGTAGKAHVGTHDSTAVALTGI